MKQIDMETKIDLDRPIQALFLIAWSYIKLGFVLLGSFCFGYKIDFETEVKVTFKCTRCGRQDLPESHVYLKDNQCVCAYCLEKKHRERIEKEDKNGKRS